MTDPTRSRTDAVADFLRYAETERRLSVHTVDAYRRDLADFESFPQGDKTETGEMGITLSGG